MSLAGPDTPGNRDNAHLFCKVAVMPTLIPGTVDEAVSQLAQHPAATLLAGGTDLMVEINEGHRRPDGPVILLNRIAELRTWSHDPIHRSITIGAAITYTELLTDPLAALLPALADASRTVGSPQIRNAGTLGGNLGTCSPAGDSLPVLAALDATINVASLSGRRSIPIVDFMVGPKRNSLDSGELIVSVTVPVIDGWQGYAKVGVRNAMVISVASVALVLDRSSRSVRIALGSVGPAVLRCPTAEAQLSNAIDWETMHVNTSEVDRFAEFVKDASAPITDHRSTAEYRTHAVEVLARRLVSRAVARQAA